MAQLVKTALVTGGARRIGRAIVEDLAANGYAVAVHCNQSRDEAEALSAGLNSNGFRTAVFQADLTDAVAAEKIIGDVVDRLGPLGLLVNNASIFEEDSVGSFDRIVADRHFAIHVHAPALLARRFAETLPAESQGLIVNIIDQRVWRLTPRYFSYTLSKSALWTATRTMAQALAPRIRVNAVGPGPTMANIRQRPEDFQAQTDALLLERGPEPSEFGAAIRYLADARSITGQMLAVDGGQHLAWQTPDVTGMVE